LYNFELIIRHGQEIIFPQVLDGVVWETNRRGMPGKLTFKMLNAADLMIVEGDPVRFKYDGHNIFYGFIFVVSGDADYISVTAYDQMRYLKNKETIIYKELTASDLLERIAKEFNLQIDTLKSTEHVIPKRVESDSTLLDMMYFAIDSTLRNINKLFVLFDNFGKLALENIEDMRLDLLIDADTCKGFKMRSSIDNAFNKIKLARDNDLTGKRDIYIAQDSSNMNKWGVLQYSGKLQDGENGQVKADMLLKLFNQRTRRFTVSDNYGDPRVRGGSSVAVLMDLGLIQVKSYLVVDKAKHTFRHNEHVMNLELRGGKQAE